MLAVNLKVVFCKPSQFPPKMASSIREIGNNTEVDQILNRDFTSSFRTSYVEVGEDNFCMPVYYKDNEERIRKFEVRDDDVFIAAHPKTGTTWTQEMVWLIVNNLDYAEASRRFLDERFPQLEFSTLFDLADFDLSELGIPKDTIDSIGNTKSPRCIKTHLHWSLLPEEIRNGNKMPKIIVVLRNAEDTCVSLYHHSISIDGYKGNFEDFCELFLAGRVCFGPFWKQVLSYWKQRDRSNILFIKYKEMKEDLMGVIRRVVKFLDKELTQDQIQKLSEHLNFDSMRQNSSVNHEKVVDTVKEMFGKAELVNSYVRQGKVGGFKTAMSPELIQRFEAWTKENLKDTGLTVE